MKEHVFGALLTMAFLACCGATLYHNYITDNDPVVQKVTTEALEWKASNSSE